MGTPTGVGNDGPPAASSGGSRGLIWLTLLVSIAVVVGIWAFSEGVSLMAH
jgi:hypothetical protein